MKPALAERVARLYCARCLRDRESAIYCNHLHSCLGRDLRYAAKLKRRAARAARRRQAIQSRVPGDAKQQTRKE